jgi:hypothetical protein
MSHGSYGGRHRYEGTEFNSRARRTQSKLGQVVSLDRLEALLRGHDQGHEDDQDHQLEDPEAA